MYILEEAMPGYTVHGISGMPTHQLVQGRPYGGCAIACKQQLKAKVTPLSTMNSNRLCGVSVEVDSDSFLLFCVYMPCDDVSNADTYREILDEIAVTHTLLSPSIGTIIGGDFNTAFDRTASMHTKLLSEFLINNSFACPLMHSCADASFTFESKANGNRLIIDHFVISTSLYDCITTYESVHSGLNVSDHMPIELELCMPTSSCEFASSSGDTFKWRTTSGF